MREIKLEQNLIELQILLKTIDDYLNTALNSLNSEYSDNILLKESLNI